VSRKICGLIQLTVEERATPTPMSGRGMRVLNSGEEMETVSFSFFLSFFKEINSDHSKY
jgi:hypothetical protein